MKDLKKLLLIISIFTLIACQCSQVVVHKQIKIANLSKNDIVYQNLLNLSDTCFIKSHSGLMFVNFIKSDSSSVLLEPDSYTFLDDYLMQNKVLHILIADALEFEKYKNAPYDSVCKYLKIYKYQVKLDDMIKTNWTITYPPIESIKDMHMYLPYKK